jgi:hypothetical protein
MMSRPSFQNEIRKDERRYLTERAGIRGSSYFFLAAFRVLFFLAAVFFFAALFFFLAGAFRFAGALRLAGFLDGTFRFLLGAGPSCAGMGAN